MARHEGWRVTLVLVSQLATSQLMAQDMRNATHNALFDNRMMGYSTEELWFTDGGVTSN